MKALPLPSQERLKELFDYNEEEGKLIWNKRGKGKTVGEKAGTVKSNYTLVKVDGVLYNAHRLIWMYCYGEDPKSRIVEHANRDGNNNKLNNLRLANESQNGTNKFTACRNTSGFKGVKWVERMGQWSAQIAKNGKEKHLGFYDCPKEAYEGYIKASGELHGEFACGGIVEIDSEEAARRRKLNDVVKEKRKSRGVVWIKSSKKWRSRKKQKHLGYFNTFEEAKAAYDNA